MALISLEVIALAIPPLPTEFYGRIRDYNNNATPGETVYAYDSSGTLCGSFTIVNTGFYGSLTCMGDDPESSSDEGAVPNENISFRYKGGFTTATGDVTWELGVFKYVNLTYPVVFCGDVFCDAEFENNFICPIDCPLYNASQNISINGTMNITSNETNVSAGGGTGQGAGVGGGGGAQPKQINRETPAGLQGPTINASGMEGYGLECKESWSCSNWSVCRINGYQDRICSDSNRCGSFEDKPAEVQKCIYTPTCSDGVRNGLEEGIDCGGLCPPCIGCFDGIQNCHDDKCEEDIDCGGPCAPCPSCFDGMRNCHEGLCEDGVDCGGPCDAKCPEVELPRPIFVCKKDVNPFSNGSILFFMVILLVILGDIIYSQHRIKELRRNKDLKDIERIKGIFSTRRKMYLFILITVLIAILLYLYYYFFVMCETDYKFIWWLLLLLLAVPAIIHEVIRYLEYSESKKLKKFEDLLNTHYKQIDSLIKIENESLEEMEQELSAQLDIVLDSLRGVSSDECVLLLREIYELLNSLYIKYRNRESPFEQEKLLCEDIYHLIENKNYSASIEANPTLKSIFNKLKILYLQYEEKQKLYDELDKVDSSRKELGLELSGGGEKKE